mmetsp:Transcript_12841/g.28510  ORF Transcript_12841/g.28510 Transcript_12841/m.28510 type:complete len:221 (+) Transcript_12841:488-1150(+)
MGLAISLHATRIFSAMEGALAGPVKRARYLPTSSQSPLLYFLRCMSETQRQAMWASSTSTPAALTFALSAASTRLLSMSFVRSLASSHRPCSLFSWKSARSQMLLASGSLMASAAKARAGLRVGRKGSASKGSSTSLDILSMMTADWRRVAVTLDLSPLIRSGTTIARAGDCTDCTNVTPAKACIISGTSSGLEMDRTILSVMCSMSRLPITLQACVMAW